MKTLIMLLLSTLLSTLFMGGCGSSGGGSGSSGTVFDQQNVAVSSYMDSAEKMSVGINRADDLISEALGSDWRDRDWGPDDIIGLLGEEGASKLLAEINELNTKVIGPALDDMATYGEDLEAAEQEIAGLINFAPSKEGTYISEPRFVFLTAFAILSAFTTAGLAVAYEFKKNQNSNTGDPVTDLVDSIADYKDYAWTAGSTFVVSGAESAATSIAGAAAKAKDLVVLAASIDVASKVKSAYDYGTVLIGIQEESSNTKAPSLLSVLQRVQRADEGTYYIGSSDKNGVFNNIPRGDWSFVVTANGLVRTVINVSLESDSNSVVIPMRLISELDETTDENIEEETDIISTNISISGYSGTFNPLYSGIGLGSRNDGPNIYPFILAMTIPPQSWNGRNADVFDIIFERSLAQGGTYPLGSSFEGTGITFMTPQILNQDLDKLPVLFDSVSGSITLTEFGVNYGDRVSGSFTAYVEGWQDFCANAACDKTTRKTLTGNISGTFNGIIQTEEELSQ